jgi:hypothetical protein
MLFVPRSIQNTHIPCDHNVEFLNVNLVVRKVTGRL